MDLLEFCGAVDHSNDHVVVYERGEVEKSAQALQELVTKGLWLTARQASIPSSMDNRAGTSWRKRSIDKHLG